MQDYLFNYLQNLQGSGAKVVGVGAFWGKLNGAATDLSSNLTKFGMLAAVTGLVIARFILLVWTKCGPTREINDEMDSNWDCDHSSNIFNCGLCNKSIFRRRILSSN
ncbi:hypothetical protein QY890_01245 [Latilactobacillus sakei]